jgi:hypothetical protein
MAVVRINALPAGTPTQSKKLAMDLSTAENATIKDIVYAGRPAASQAEAEAGTDSDKVMTAVTTKQSIASQVGVTIASNAQGAKADSALQPSAIGVTVASAAQGVKADAALPAASKLSQAEAVAGTEDAKYMTALSGAQQADGRMFPAITGGLSRTAPARFGDVVDLDEKLPGDGSTPINGTPFTELLVYMAANPGKTYRSRKNRKYFLNAAVAFPDNIKLRLEGAEFYLGASLGTGATALTFGADTDADQIRLRVLGSNTLYRGIYTGDRFKGGLVAYADTQQANSGSQLYRAIRINGNDSDLDYVESRFFDFGVLVYGEAAANTGTVIRRLKAQSYCNAVKVRDVSDFRLQDYTITGRSPNGLSNAGQNGVLVEGAQYSSFQDGYIEGAPEHAKRFGGFGSFINTKGCKVRGLTTKSSGQTGVKAYTGSLANIMQDMSFSDITVIDAGDNGDAVGFNDFGFMLQNINGLHCTGLTSKNRDLAVSAYDCFYLSSITRGELSGLQAYSAARNAMRISEYNDDGTNSGSINTLDVIGLQSESHAAAGVYLEFPGGQAMRHLAFKDTHLIGGTTGFDSNAAAARFAQQTYFEGVINGQSGVRFNLPVTANIKVVDLLDPSSSVTYDPPSLVDGAGTTTTITVTGAALGDYAVASFSLDLQGITMTYCVSAANTVSVRFQNETGGTVDLASGTLRAKVIKS